MSEDSGRNPVVTGALVALFGLIVAGALGFLLMWIGSNRMEAAKRTERPYLLALGYVAQDGVRAATKAQASLAANNWGEAQAALDEAGKAVTVMEQAASDANREQTHQVRLALSAAQAAVGKPDKDAPGKVADLRVRLQAFTVAPAAR